MTNVHRITTYRNTDGSIRAAVTYDDGRQEPLARPTPAPSQPRTPGVTYSPYVHHLPLLADDSQPERWTPEAATTYRPPKDDRRGSNYWSAVAPLPWTTRRPDARKIRPDDDPDARAHRTPQPAELGNVRGWITVGAGLVAVDLDDCSDVGPYISQRRLIAAILRAWRQETKPLYGPRPAVPSTIAAKLLTCDKHHDIILSIQPPVVCEDCEISPASYYQHDTYYCKECWNDLYRSDPDYCESYELTHLDPHPTYKLTTIHHTDRT